MHSKTKREQYGFLFHQKRCNGCKTCEMACKDYHKLANGLALRTVYEFSGGTWEQDNNSAWTQNAFVFRLSVSCGHCGSPVCMRICPADALTRDIHGFVSISAEKCVGCQSCVIACPYHAPRFDETQGVSVKCDGCSARLMQGLEPICVEACPQHAPATYPMSELENKGNIAASIVPLPNPVFTQPNLVIDQCEAASKVHQGDGTLINIRET